MKYGPEITAEIAGYISSGLNRTDSVVLANISYETFCAWTKEHLEFSEAIKQAEIRFKQIHIHRIAKAGETVWQASAWLLERKFPDEFALKKEYVDLRDKEIPQKMAERAHELLSKLENKKKSVPVGVNGNGNGLHT